MAIEPSKPEGVGPPEVGQVDALVIGAGVVGLAVARALALAGREVWILEAAEGIGTGISSRNSEVIHAGLYYPSGSLKTRLCVRGRDLLYAYCAARGVDHRRCGKLVVAVTDDERPTLRALWDKARANGVHSLQWLEGAQARALEPGLRCVAALHSPDSGIVDSHALMLALLGDAEAAGATLALRSRFTSARRRGQGWQVRVQAENEQVELRCDWIVNAAGLAAPALARTMQGFPATAIPHQRLAKGHYFSLSGAAPFSRLVYPLPTDGGLGVHLTLDLGGQARFGPDVQWLPEDCDPATLDYGVDPGLGSLFEAGVRLWWPDLPAEALQPAYSGVRPKLSGPGQAAADFHIAGPADHGVPGVVQLFGIESPGLTASLAIAEAVMHRLDCPGAAPARDACLSPTPSPQHQEIS